MSAGPPAESAPAEPKPEGRRSLLDKIGPAVAVGLTALAAVFGSMSASALQQAMYYKSQAAQDQSKAANQWGVFGFKRSRALEMETSAARSRSESGYLNHQFSGDGEEVKWLNGDGPPRVELPKHENKDIEQLVKDIRARKPEADLVALAARIPVEDLNKAIEEFETFNHQTTEEKWDAVVKAAKKLAQKDIDAAERNSPDQLVDAAKKARADAAQAKVYLMEELRYRGEAFLNNELGYLYETRIKASTAESDKQRRKSAMLSYAMLVAQIGAVAASLALARRRGASLWIVASLIGFIAIGFAGYALIPASLLAFPK